MLLYTALVCPHLEVWCPQNPEGHMHLLGLQKGESDEENFAQDKMDRGPSNARHPHIPLGHMQARSAR